jgi:hypothetical protein
MAKHVIETLLYAGVQGLFMAARHKRWIDFWSVGLIEISKQFGKKSGGA